MELELKIDQFAQNMSPDPDMRVLSVFKILSSCLNHFHFLVESLVLFLTN